METVPRKRLLPKVVLVLIFSICSMSWSPSSKAAQATHSGDAEVLHAGLSLEILDVLNLTVTSAITVDLVPVGPLPPDGGFLENHLLTVSGNLKPQLSLLADVASATTAGSGFDSYSQAEVAAVNLGAGPVTPTLLAVTADVIQANSHAGCVAPPSGGVALDGSSVVANLKINGTAITVTGQPNQIVHVPLVADIIINEQIASAAATSATMTTNALHIKLQPLGKLLTGILTGDIIISHASSDISNCAIKPPCPDTNNPACNTCPDRTNPACPPVCPDPTNPLCPTTCPDPNNPDCPVCTVKDFITGGGQVTKNGKAVTFSTHGGINTDGSLTNGHLNVVDHGSGEHIQSTGFFSYFDPNAPSTKRTLGFYCNGASGTTCTVQVSDNGEPGTADTWKITTNGGYTAGSTTTPIARGNIQLHKPAGCTAAPPPPPPPPPSPPPGKKPHK